MRLQDVKGDVEWSALEAELLRCAPLGDVLLSRKGDRFQSPKCRTPLADKATT